MPSSNKSIENRAYFDKWAKTYDEGRLYRWFRYTQGLVIDMLSLQPNSKLLDVGCGTGFAVLQFAPIVCKGKACGIDISEGMIERATEKVPADLKGRVEFRAANSDNIPYPSRYFDYVICTNSFHHYPDPARSLAEMRRVLCGGGKVLILENAPDLSWYTWAWDRVLRIIERGHVRYYSSRELGEMIKRAGFERVELRHLKNEFLSHGKLFASIQVWTGHTPEGS